MRELLAVPVAETASRRAFLRQLAIGRAERFPREEEVMDGQMGV
jgi:hypothetical protein